MVEHVCRQTMIQLSNFGFRLEVVALAVHRSVCGLLGLDGHGLVLHVLGQDVHPGKVDGRLRGKRVVQADVLFKLCVEAESVFRENDIKVRFGPCHSLGGDILHLVLSLQRRQQSSTDCKGLNGELKLHDQRLDQIRLLLIDFRRPL